MHTFIVQCGDEKATRELAGRLSKISKAGDVWALFGTLGMGKSVFSRGFIQKLCPSEDVPSPTFTLLQTYPAENFDIYHYDLYRLKSPEEIWELNIEEAMSTAVCLIEWPEKMGAYLPRDIFKVEISASAANGRQFIFKTASDEKAARLTQVLGAENER